MSLSTIHLEKPPKVVGITHAGKAENEEDNNSKVLQAFRDIGYDVCHNQVCASRVGVPMTRNRIHYIGLSSSAIKNSKEQCSLLDSVWKTVLSAEYRKETVDRLLSTLFGYPLFGAQVGGLAQIHLC